MRWDRRDDLDLKKEWMRLEDAILEKGDHIRTGAEARIFHGSFLGIDAIVKDRYPRTYRVKELDENLRRKRVRSEARLLMEARELGLNTPHLLDLDLENCVIIMEYLPYPSLKEVLQRESGRLQGETGEEVSRNDKIGMISEGGIYGYITFLIREAGRLVGTLHTNDIIHGDLTTSNILVNDRELWFIDFGLAEKTAEIEVKGVDLHVFSEAFESTHSVLLQLLEDFFRGYIEGNRVGGKEVIQRAEEVSKRGRYS